MKVLFVENHAGFCKFNAPYYRWFISQGWQVDHASPGIENAFRQDVSTQIDIPIQRSPFSWKNIKAILMLWQLINHENYDLIHCHTEMGGLCARIAAFKARRKGCKVIYTSHNYPFYTGASWWAWAIYYTIERLLAPLTDAVVTINQEDYEVTCRHKFAKGRNYKINGVGIDLQRFHPLSMEKIMIARQVMGIRTDSFVILYTAQFIPRKNHKMLIEALPKLTREIPNLLVLFAGNGPTMEACKLLAEKKGVADSISFLGGRRDVDNLCQIADIHVAPSLLEGQGINNIEAMACGCPLVVSDVRGHRDVCKPNRNGFLFSVGDSDQMIEAIVRLYQDKELFNDMSKNNIHDASIYDVDREVEAMAHVYKDVLEDRPVLTSGKKMTGEEIKNRELSILCSFADYCNRHKFQYRLAYGTLLGAIRHKGFIPWDDDVDVVMLRDDYEKLIQCVKKEPISPTIALWCLNNGTWHEPIGKLTDTTTVAYAGEKNIGLWVDIFPLDFYDKNVFWKNRALRSIQIAKTTNHFSYNVKSISKAALKFLFFWLDIFKLGNLINNNAKSVLPNDKICCLYTPYKHDIWEKSIFDEYVEVEFEGYKFRAIKKWDYYLRTLYGDYMQLPPFEKQRTHQMNAYAVWGGEFYAPQLNEESPSQQYE